MVLNRTILLTGATGFLGSHLLASFIASGFAVIVLKRRGSNLERIEHLASRFESYDIDRVRLTDVFKQHSIDTVVHTACSYGRNSESVSEVVKSNLMFGLELLDEAVKAQVATFINTDSLLPRSLNVYSLSKSQLVDWLQFYANRITVLNLKLEHMYGAKDDEKKLVYWFLQQLKNNKSIDLTTGEQLRDFIYIDDVVSAFTLLLQKSGSMNGFNEYEVGTGQSTPVHVFLSELKHCYESRAGLSKSKLNFGAIPYRDGEVMNVRVNNLSLLSMGWSPNVTLQNGIEKVVRDFL